MNLYRLDIDLGDGTSYPVADFMGPRLFRSRAAVDEAGRSAAAYSGQPVTLTRISGAGHLKVMGTFSPGVQSTFTRSR